MVDAIIVLIVIVLLIFALKGTLKHFKGESPCCGGGSGTVKKVKENPHACVFFPSYKPACDHNPLGKLINEVALSLQVETLVTGNYEKLKDLQNPVKDVIIVKQSFRSGKELRAQIEELKAMGYDVSVLCLIAHSGAKVEAFAHENGVPVSAIVYTDEISYI